MFWCCNCPWFQYLVLSSPGHMRTSCWTALSVLPLRWIVLLCELLKSSGFNLFIPVILPVFHDPQMTLRYPPNCLQTHTLQLHRVLTNFSPARLSHFSPLRLYFISQHGAMTSPLHTSLHSCQAAWLLSHLLLPPAIYLLPPPLLQSHFENVPLLIPPLPSADWSFSRCASERYRAYLSLQASGGSQSILWYILETRSCKFK